MPRHKINDRVLAIREGEVDVIYVPLGQTGENAAVLYADDLAFLQRLGVSLNWTKAGNRCGVHCTRIGGKKAMVSRMLTGAREGEFVTFEDGNPFNLRRDNLIVKKGNKKAENTRAFVQKEKKRERSLEGASR